MKKKEIQEIYEIFLKCLPKSCVRPEIFKIYSSWRKMVDDSWGDWIRDLVESNCGVKLGKLDILKLDLEKSFDNTNLSKIYPYSNRIEEIHDVPSSKSSSSIEGFANPFCKKIFIYSRGVRNVIDLLSKLLHETGHLNVDGDFGMDNELEVERWLWKRWPYVYGKYKKLARGFLK